MRKKVRRKRRKKSEKNLDSEEVAAAKEATEELDFGDDIDLKGLIKEGDPALTCFISLKAKKFMDYFNPNKLHLGRRGYRFSSNIQYWRHVC